MIKRATFLGGIAYYFLQLLIKTFGVKICAHPEIDPTKNYVYGFWHGKLFAPIALLISRAHGKHAGLVSNSRDGEILANCMERLGYKLVRGSSSRKALSSMVKLIAIAKQGYSVGIAADGPRGPRWEAKAGLSFVAYKSGLEIIPYGVCYSARWQFEKSWDKYQLPKPFAKVVLYLDKPIKIIDLDRGEEINHRLAQAINIAERKAELIMAGHSQESIEGLSEGTLLNP